MTLEVRDTMSLYYSMQSRFLGTICDSLRNLGERLKDNPEEMKQVKGIKPFHLQVAKNYPSKGIYTNSDYIMESVYFEEKMPQIKWKISLQKRNIIGYDCQMAETDWLGRHWTVWYTEDIPISEGPWLLYGLPGLILAAQDNEQIYRIEAVAIKQSKEKDINIYNKGKLITRKLFWEQRKEHDENPSAAIKRHLGFTSNETTFKFSYADENGNTVEIDEYPPIHQHYYENE